MLTPDAYNMAVLLMLDHGLFDGPNPWGFRFENSTRRMGKCDYNNRLILLSSRLTAVNEAERVRDVILHEIAHAIVGPRLGHGQEWAAKAKEIGCCAEPSIGEDSELDFVDLPKVLVEGRCPACGYTIRMKRRRIGMNCTKCLHGQFVWERREQEAVR